MQRIRVFDVFLNQTDSSLVKISKQFKQSFAFCSLFVAETVKNVPSGALYKHLSRKANHLSPRGRAMGNEAERLSQRKRKNLDRDTPSRAE
jgi:hypothetical protein